MVVLERPSLREKKVKFDLELLTEEEERNQYQDKLDRNHSANTTSDGISVEEKWHKIQSSMMKAAETVLQKTGLPPTPRRSEAEKKYFLATQKKIADRNNPILRKEVMAARVAKQEAYKVHFSDKVHNFFRRGRK